MDRVNYFVLYNNKRNGYYYAKGVKSFWEPNILLADKFLTERDIKEVSRWFPQNEIEIKKITLIIE